MRLLSVLPNKIVFSCVALAAVWLGSAVAPPLYAQARGSSSAADALKDRRSRIAALLKEQKVDQALTAYDDYVKSVGKTDMTLLAVVARAEVARALAEHPEDPRFALPALERLASQGDPDALKNIERMAASFTGTSSAALGPLTALARLGHPDAAARLGELLKSAPADDLAQVIRALQDGNARSQAPRIVALLGDSQPEVLCAASLAVGALQFSDAVGRLQELFQQAVPIVRMCAAAGLKRLGQSSADALLSDLLRNGAPEVRLIAAEAYQSSGASKQWMPPIKALLSDRNEYNRIRAAELLACCDQAAARASLLDALGSSNLSMRTEAARVLEATGLADAKLARRLLGDSSDAVRLYGAAAALRSVAVR